MKMSDFSPEEQAEIVRAVIEASVDEHGHALPLEDARERFDRFLTDAVQAHREWADRLLDGFRLDGERAFVRHVQKSDAFVFFHNGKKRRRSLRRGTRKQDAEGARRWVQESLLSFSAEQLEQAIKESVNRIEQERANIAMYRALIELLRETGAAFVGEALELAGKSLEQFLAERDVA